LLSKVVNPGRLTKYSDIESGIALWQEKVETLESQFGETLSPKMKIAILLNAMPTGLQDQVMQHMPPDGKAGYTEIRDMIRRFAARKLESSGPTAMDIGAVDNWGNRCNYEHLGLHQEENQWEWSEPHQDPWVSVQEVSVEEKVSAFDAWAAGGFEDGINGIQDHSRSICYNCNQTGHISPQCPKGKGKGKIARAKGKGEKDSREKFMANTSPREIGIRKEIGAAKRERAKAKAKAMKAPVGIVIRLATKRSSASSRGYRPFKVCISHLASTCSRRCQDSNLRSRPWGPSGSLNLSTHPLGGCGETYVRRIYPCRQHPSG